ncbi:sulfite:cytochrome C oxidoreductase subunit B [Sulfurimonas sp.]|uniref:sulfite:cytochrome C oxidoreductase subunit B n=1 Tax=Sulfurimonas sp. TaxID=2022749 RepID=UPI0025FEB572|nr:sulfite:cytochrome C oxidoreductase subunit B [Sulfurimonas sp.]
MRKIILITILTITSLFAQVKENIEVPYVSYSIKMGKGFEEVNTNCLMCHSFGYFINQGPQPRAFWREKIIRMVDAFKAPISDKDAKTIENYLTTYYGNGK